MHEDQSAPLIIGRNALFEVLKHAPERIERVYIAARHNPDKRHRQLEKELSNGTIPVESISEPALDALTAHAVHQGFAARVSPLPQPSFKDFCAEFERHEQGLVLLLDAINDPQNMGALLRAAECFGADAVLFSKNRGCGISAAVSKASVGASQFVTVIEVANLVDAALKLKQSGFWLLAADFSEQAQDISAYDFPPKSAIILGSEGAGIQPLLREKVDLVLSIPLHGKLRSLNVSQAAAVFLYAYRQTQHSRGDT